MKVRSMVMATAIGLAACSVSSVRRGHPDASPPGGAAAAAQESEATLPTATVDYTYQLLTPQATGLAQVFDDGRWTYVSFESEVPTGLMMFDNEGRGVAFSCSG